MARLFSRDDRGLGKSLIVISVSRSIKIGLIGAGSIGSIVARALDRMKEVESFYIFDRSTERAASLDLLPGASLLTRSMTFYRTRILSWKRHLRRPSGRSR